ncbi:MAG: DUF4918 family protein, partial [Saprospiraceae bacterium]|nr:DUF4918 family protein [Saprospiraceae bacterium]
MIEDHIQQQISFGSGRATVLSMGQGKNFKFLKKLNDERGYFEQVVPLPHPRWVMQYRLKRKQEFIDQYVQALTDAANRIAQ